MKYMENRNVPFGIAIGAIVLVAGIVMVTVWSGIYELNTVVPTKNQEATASLGKVVPTPMQIGDFGPYEYEAEKRAFVAVSDRHRAIAYYRDGYGYVTVDDTEYGPYDGVWESSLQVSDNFWGIIISKRETDSNAVVINGNEVNLPSAADNIIFSFFDTKKSWWVDYNGVGRNVSIVNGRLATNTDYGELSDDIIPYQMDGDYYVNFNGDEHLIGSIYDEGALWARCMSYDKGLWGCSVGKRDGAWHIFVYRDGVRRDYGPYGHFSDPRERSEFSLSSNGFIFCSSDMAVVNKDEREQVYRAEDIDHCAYSEGNFGFRHTDGENSSLSVVNFNGKEFKSYKFIENFSINGSGWGFSGWGFNGEDKTEYVVNGTTISDVQVIAGPALSRNYWSVGYEKNGKLYQRVESMSTDGG